MKERYNPVFDSINEDSLSVRKKKEKMLFRLYCILSVYYNEIHICSFLNGVYVCCITVI